LEEEGMAVEVEEENGAKDDGEEIEKETEGPKTSGKT
jgi:hypothetical protein